MDALEKALSSVRKVYGDTAVMSELMKMPKLDVNSFGVYALDQIVGCGGIPRGKIIEIYGKESSCKTTLALMAAAIAQKKRKVLFIDLEHAIDMKYAKALGVDSSLFLLAQPSSGEEAFDIAHTLIKSGGIELVIWDSVAAFTTEQQREGDVGDANIASVARMFSQELKSKIIPQSSMNNTANIFLNQTRNNPGAYGMEYTPGGSALKFYSSIRIKLTKDSKPDSKSNLITAKVVKNKCGMPFQTCELKVYYGKGIDNFDWVLSEGIKVGLIEKRGSHLSLAGTQMGQGKDEAKKFLKNLSEKQILKVVNEIKERTK